MVSFLNAHPLVIALATSLVWLFAGRDYFRKGMLAGAVGWAGIGILVLVGFCIRVAFTGESWSSFAVAVAAIVAEVWQVRKWLSQ
jgi:hypothetical protein